MDHVAIDFEANCLPRHGRSFPIEVWVTDGRGVRSWLIRPVAERRAWDCTNEALALHGISPERRVVADSSLDSYWWRMLAGGAGARAESCAPIGPGTMPADYGPFSIDSLALSSTRPLILSICARSTRPGIPASLPDGDLAITYDLRLHPQRSGRDEKSRRLRRCNRLR